MSTLSGQQFLKQKCIQRRIFVRKEKID